LDTVSEILGLAQPKATFIKDILPEFDLLNEEDLGKNLADSLSSLRKEISASHVWLLSEFGRVAAQSGETEIEDFETKWAALIMPIMSASENFTQTIDGKRPDRAVISIGIKDHNIFMAPVGDYALVLRVPTGRGTNRVPLIVDVMMEYQQEILSILSRMGVLPADQGIFNLDDMDEEQLVNTFIKEEVEDDSLQALLDSKGNLPLVDKFWEEADVTAAYDLDNPEILTFDQASKLGLTPDEQEE